MAKEPPKMVDSNTQTKTTPNQTEPYRPPGVWLEISEIEYDSDYGGKPAIVARFKADMDPRRDPAWWPVKVDDEVSKEYDRFLKWLDKGRVLLGRLGIDGGKLMIVGVRTHTPRDDS